MTSGEINKLIKLSPSTLTMIFHLTPVRLAFLLFLFVFVFKFVVIAAKQKTNNYTHKE